MVLGTLSAVVVGWLLKVDRAAVLGVLSGATTNTPSLGAAQQTLSSFPSVSAEQAALPAMAYAVTYPMGIVGIIATLLMLKTLFRADIASELEAHAAAGPANTAPLQQRTIIVENANLAGVEIQDVPALAESGVVVSRVRHADAAEVLATTRRTSLRVGDRLLVVGSPEGLDRFQRVVGRSSEENLLERAGTVTEQRIVVTNKSIVGQTVGQLDLETLYGVVATRVARGEIELTAEPSLRVQFGDVLQVVGPEEAVERAAAHLGNSLQALNETQFVPMFAGIAAGIALGTLPIPCPGLPQPLRLGLAAGPLIVAIIVGRIGRHRPPGVAHAAQRESGLPRIRHRAVLCQRRLDGRADVFLRGV